MRPAHPARDRRLRQSPRLAAGDDGAQGRSRTADTVIFSHVLYQLSYLGVLGISSPARRGTRAGSAGVIEARFEPVQNNGETPY